jgi:phytoene dehydrogenase-like protein
MSVSTVHDVIVIGSGHNGLVAACYLAREGLDVLVVEAARTAGGMTHSGPMISEAPEHVVSTCALDTLFLRASDTVADLGLARHGLREIPVDPANVWLHRDGASIAIWKDPVRTADEIRRFSAADADAYLHLMRVLDKAGDVALPYLNTHPLRPNPRSVGKALGAAARAVRALRELPRIFTAPALQTIEERFQHPIVRDFLCGACGVVGPIDQDAGGFLFFLFSFQHRFGAWRIAGGTQRLPDALISVLQSTGGSIRTSAAVEEIVVRGGRATGVRLAGGEELSARLGVLSSADPTTTLARLLPEGHLDDRTAAAVRSIPANADGWADLRIDLALSGQVSLARFEQWRGDGLDLRRPGIWVGDRASALASYPAARAGLVPGDISTFMAVPTGIDPGLAPPGEDTVYLWANPMPLGADADWDAAAKALVSKAGEFYDGLDLEVGRWVENAPQRSQRLGVTNGAIYHTDLSAFRVGPLRPALGLSGYRTPVDGLFLGGAGSHPCPCVTALPGRLAAAEVIRASRRRA